MKEEQPLPVGFEGRTKKPIAVWKSLEVGFALIGIALALALLVLVFDLFPGAIYLL